ncbi:MAG: hypothetical protein ACRDCN_07350 [Tannerellaceae bacterium]
MCKKILSFLMFLSVVVSIEAATPFKVEKVYPIEDMNANEIAEGILQHIKEANDMPRMFLIDQKDNEIIYKATFNAGGLILANYSSEGTIDATIKIQTKDDRYKVTIQNFYHKAISEDFINVGEIYDDAEHFSKENRGRDWKQEKRHHKMLLAECKKFSNMLLKKLAFEKKQEEPTDDNW